MYLERLTVPQSEMDENLGLIDIQCMFTWPTVHVKMVKSIRGSFRSSNFVIPFQKRQLTVETKMRRVGPCGEVLSVHVTLFGLNVIRASYLKRHRALNQCNVWVIRCNYIIPEKQIIKAPVLLQLHVWSFFNQTLMIVCHNNPWIS